MEIDTQMVQPFLKVFYCFNAGIFITWKSNNNNNYYYYTRPNNNSRFFAFEVNTWPNVNRNYATLPKFRLFCIMPLTNTVVSYFRLRVMRSFIRFHRVASTAPERGDSRWDACQHHRNYVYLLKHNIISISSSNYETGVARLE